MKKQFKLALAVIMVLGSVKAFAMTDEDIMIMNTEGKIEAAMGEEGCSTCERFDFMEGKIEAAAAMNMKFIVQDAQKKVSEIKKIGNLIGTSMEDSQGLIKFIGEKEHFAELALSEMKRLEKASDSLSGENLFNAHSRMIKLASEIRSLNEETQMTVDKILSGR